MQIFKDTFEDLKILETIKIEDLSISPISYKNIDVESNIKTFDELFNNDEVEAFELGKEGVVQEIGILNKSKDQLFIFDGEALVGAKQNRISQKSVIINSDTKIKIPVNCVEQGRWQFKKNTNFEKSEFSLGPRTREKKASILKKNNNSESIQEVVWNDIAMLSCEHSSHSNTSDLGEVLFKSINEKKYELLSKLENVKCNGFIVFGTDRIFIELFSNHEICEKLKGKFISGWLGDLNKSKKVSFSPDEIINNLINSHWAKETSVGIEETFSSEINNNGRAIFLDNKFVHGYYYI